MTKTIAIVGGGIVGTTAAYYLVRDGHAVTLFDKGTGQATKAAAGIICPWLSKRRNKPWYRLASGGAAFFHQLINDLTTDGIDTSFYHRSGAVLLKKRAKATEEQYQLGLKRREDAPEIGELKILNQEELSSLLPSLQTQHNALFVEGGARVDGSLYIETMQKWLAENGGTVIRERASLTAENQLQTTNHSYTFDKIILTVGAWLPSILEPLGWEVDIRPQKGQLVVMQTTDHENHRLPVIMPEGEIDVLPIGEGKVIVGASHENDQGYDLKPDEAILQDLVEKGTALFTKLEGATVVETKVGTRAYTSDFSPFFGFLPTSMQILVASGLGSSGLTTGPFIGYQLALLAQEKPITVPLEDYLPDPYLSY